MANAAFLDRDGVINEKMPDGQYVTCWEEMKFLPGAAVSMAALRNAGFRLIVVTNQRCVAKGLITREGLEAIHVRMCDRFAAVGACIDAVYYCPHDYAAACACRKPAPGLLLHAAKEHDLDLASSWMIGDSDVDVAAGKNAGCRTARLADLDQITNWKADVTATSLGDAVREILQLTNLETDGSAKSLVDP